MTRIEPSTTIQEPDLSVTLCGVRLPNPTVLASGVLGLSHEIFGRPAQSGCGAITTKSCSLQPRTGHHNPVIVDWGYGLINAVGLSNPGVEVMVEEIRQAKQHLAPVGVPIIASIFAETIYDFGIVARYISEAQPDLIEVNISCPNVDDKFVQTFAASPYVAAQVTRRVKANTSIPVVVKLSPNVEDIAKVAREVEAAGADAITAINGLGPGLVLDVETGQPVLANRWGGVSGPAIRPVAVKCVRDVCKVVKIPVIGTGGVTDARDAVEMILVGATAVGIGSAAHSAYRGMDVFGEVATGMATRGWRISGERHSRIVKLTMLPRTVRISDVIEETRAVKTFVLDNKIDAQSGQFVMLWLPGVDEKPISIAAPDPLTLTVAKVGPFSIALHECKVGDLLSWRGPFGRPFRLDPARPALLVGGGYGAAPLYFLAAQAAAQGIATTVALGARRADDLIFVERFQRLGVQLLLATEDGSAGVKGFVTEAITHQLADRPTLYACGPEGMLVALHALCHEHGLPGQLSVERYMKCGFGVCGQCTLDDILVCTDGPVLDVEQLDSKLDFGRFHRTVTGRRLPV